MDAILPLCATELLARPDIRPTLFPYAVLDAIDGFRAKMEMIDRALKSALGDLDDEAHGILSDWDKAAETTKRLHNRCRNCLAHYCRNVMFCNRNVVARSIQAGCNPTESQPVGDKFTRRLASWTSSLNHKTICRRLAFALCKDTISICREKLPSTKSVIRQSTNRSRRECDSRRQLSLHAACASNSSAGVSFISAFASSIVPPSHCSTSPHSTATTDRLS